MVFWKILSFQILFSCKKEQLGWRQSILSHSLQRSHGNKPCYLDDMAAAKPLLRFSEHCWAEEDFEEECGKGEGSFESTITLLACHTWAVRDLGKRSLFLPPLETTLAFVHYSKPFHKLFTFHPLTIII